MGIMFQKQLLFVLILLVCKVSSDYRGGYGGKRQLLQETVRLSSDSCEPGINDNCTLGVNQSSLPSPVRTQGFNPNNKQADPWISVVLNFKTNSTADVCEDELYPDISDCAVIVNLGNCNNSDIQGRYCNKSCGYCSTLPPVQPPTQPLEEGIIILPVPDCNKQLKSIPKIVMSGSSTIFPIAEQVSLNYFRRDVLPIATSTGSTIGIRNLLLGAVDIASTSRPLQYQDYQNVDCHVKIEDIQEDGTTEKECQSVLPIQVKIGKDAIAVVSSPDNKLANLEIEDVIEIFSGDRFSFIIPDRQSGTFNFFIQILGKQVEENLKNVSGYSDDNELLAALSRSENSVGFVGVGYLADDTSDNIVTIDGINPLTSDISNIEQYPFFRYLYMYYNKNQIIQNQKYLTERFLCDVLDYNGQDIVRNQGFKTLNGGELLQEQRKLNCSYINDYINNNNNSTYEDFFQLCNGTRPLLVTGSSTVHEILQVAVQAVENISVIAQSTGSTAGISTFFVGGNDLASISRSFEVSDYQAAGCNIEDYPSDKPCQGRVPGVVKIGEDALSVIVNIVSTMNEVSLPYLRDIFVDDTEQFILCGADIQSGTRNFFETRIEGRITSDNFQSFTNDSKILDCVETDPDAIGFLPVSVAQNSKSVKILDVGIDEKKFFNPIDHPADYPMRRSLFIVYDKLSISENFQNSRKFICFLLSQEGQDIVLRTGFTPLSRDEICQEIEENQLDCSDTFTLKICP